MTRPVGVTASAIVAVIGSIIMLLYSGLMIAALFMPSLQSETQPPAAPLILPLVLISGALGVIGIWTSVGLFALRPWARVSILVFAGFVVTTSIFGLVAVTFLPMPADLPRDTANVVRWASMALFGVPLLIAVWWIIQFNSQATKAAFQSSLGARSARPVAVAFIAWWILSAALFPAIGLVNQTPAFVLGMTLHGWSAGIFYSFFTVASLYIGKGLLDLRDRARILAIWWFLLPTLHGILLLSMPSFRQRFFEFLKEGSTTQIRPGLFEPLMYAGYGFSLIVAAAGIWILVKNRPAFARAQSS